MRIRHICHASLLIETGGLRLATDPWFDGPAFSSQWHVFPRPLEPQRVNEAEVILISHGHEDHLHEPTLRALAAGKRAVYPYDWYDGNVPYLKSLGFCEVTEARSWKPIRLNGSVTVTFIKVGPDSIMVFEGEGRVVINVNDALHSSEPAVIDRVTAQLKARWPTIDTVFCGFGGASYYPNAIHADGKQDVDVARVREQLFAHNFCRIAQALAPAVAVPFAADFVLLAEHQRWINTVRFPREQLAGYYDRHFRQPGDRVRILPLYPGDVLEDNRLTERSPYRDRMREGGLDHLIVEQYAAEIRALAARKPPTPSDVQDLAACLLARLTEQARALPPGRLARIRFAIRLTDVAAPLCLNLSFPGGRAAVEWGVQPAPGSLFVLETTSGLLRSLFSHPWAGDVLIIGYSGDIRLAERAPMDHALFVTCMDLLTAYPSPVASLRRHPVRMARYLAQNPGLLLDRLRQKLGLRRAAAGPAAVRSLIKGSQWLTEPADQLRATCGLPEWPAHPIPPVPAPDAGCEVDPCVA